MTHAALKWFHSFSLSNGANPLDSPICHNLLEAARRDKPVSVKKAPVSVEIIKSIIDKFASPSANLTDVRVASICLLGDARFFVTMSLVISRPCILDFFLIILGCLSLGLKIIFFAKVIMFILTC